MMEAVLHRHLCLLHLLCQDTTITTTTTTIMQLLLLLSHLLHLRLEVDLPGEEDRQYLHPYLHLHLHQLLQKQQSLLVLLVTTIGIRGSTSILRLHLLHRQFMHHTLLHHDQSIRISQLRRSLQLLQNVHHQMYLMLIVGPHHKVNIMQVLRTRCQ